MAGAFSFFLNIPDRVNFWKISFLANSGLPEEPGTAVEGEYVGLFSPVQRSMPGDIEIIYTNSGTCATR